MNKDFYTDMAKNSRVLSAEEERKLITLAQRGSKSAEKKLIESNIRFIIKKASFYASKGVPRNDLVSEGIIGLITAIYKFNLASSNKFLAYANWYVLEAMQNAVYNEHAVKIPRNAFKKFCCSEDGCAATDLRSATDFRTARYLSMISMASLDSPVDDGEGATFGEFIPDPKCNIEDETATRELEEKVLLLAEQLTAQERKVLAMYYGLFGSREFSLQEIGMKFGCTRQRAAQIKNAAIKKFRARENLRLLDGFIAA